MSINDLFRQFFGFSTHRFPQEMPPSNDYDEHHSDGENHYPFADDVDNMFRHFEQHFQEVFRNFGFMEFSPSLPELVPEGKMLPSLPSAEENVPLRDRFLKQPDPRYDRHRAELPGMQPERPLLKGWFEHRRPSDDALIDHDLDSAVLRDGLDDVLEIRPDRASEPPTTRSSHSFFSSSVRVVLGADGKVEETYTKRDGFGNEETSVTRQYNDQAHSVVTRRGQDGIREHEEHFTNMDEKNLPEFEKRWNSSNTDSSILSSPRTPIEQQPSASTGILGRFFKGFF